MATSKRHLYTFAVVFSGGKEIEKAAEAEWEKDARQKVWKEFSDEQCNACESMECVEVKPLD